MMIVLIAQWKCLIGLPTLFVDLISENHMAPPIRGASIDLYPVTHTI